MAADLAKLSLWLATLAKDHPFTFLDHALRSGDSLVGLSRKQITAFHWDKTDAQQSFLEDTVRARLRRIGEYRQRILDARDLIPYAQLEQHLEAVDEDLGWLRRIGDTVIAAFFSAEKPKAREAVRQGLRDLTEKTVRSVIDLESNAKIEEAVRKLYAGPKGIRPFHWELEFPEVFRLDESGEPQGGFDAIVGNPPFLGGKRISSEFGESYRDWLSTVHVNSSRNADLAAHFFRRSFSMLRKGGCSGLIATNTIAQGDTRSTGLRWICNHAGTIFRATKRLKWPGEAAVVVSVVHICNGPMEGPFLLNGRFVDRISAYLFHSGGNDDPRSLKASSGKAFIGSNVLGLGFTFDDNDATGVATPIAKMIQLADRNPRNKEVIFPYIGGEEINSSPTQEHDRYVINFGERSETECRDSWPELMAIVEEKVKPERLLQGNIVNPDRWWLFARPAAQLTAAARGLDKVLACGIISNKIQFAFLPTGMVYSHKLVVVPLEEFSAFATLQSRIHEVWARFFSSSMKDDINYAPSDCFETFPFPEGYQSDASLDAAGKACYIFRADVMVRNSEGLTKTYNRFHDPNEDSPDIVRLRDLHAAMDRAVLDAYGWQDIQPVCEFIPEFDDEEDEDDNGRPTKKKVPLQMAGGDPRRGAGPAARAEPPARRRRAARSRVTTVVMGRWHGN